MSRPYNVAGYREQARRALPKAIFDFVDGAAGDEWTMRENRAAFERRAFLPSVLRDVSECSLATTVCNREMASPIMLAPAGLVGMMHPDGERAQVLAAREHGVIAVTSSASTYSFEELTDAVPDHRPWFQLYPYKDRGFYGEMVSRAANAGFTGLCLTVDASVSGKRERDLANHLSVRPLRVTWGNVTGAARHPRWLAGVLRERRIVARMSTEALGQDRPTLRSLLRSAGDSAANLVELLPRQSTWEDLEWLRDNWSGPLAVKGIVNPEDARHAARLGVDAIVVSNHGGRQLDGIPATFDLLPRVRGAVDEHVDLILDGGVRRGADIVKALCLGASACMVGRPWVYGLAAAGVSGVNGVLDILEEEMATTMALLGVRSVSELGSSHLA
ncbi:isopentenyl diphosphate isomerase/L-lactate dehydrogenase-like FMN-dependent dehydrogenase [Rhodococcus sp. 27YEA15]|uniref:alpha-hydroxy acid oxidase n=1 Tax=Rhodococcus sp. 27YEA15 TaxID=3156259 RepID=UPI003C7B4A30